MKELPQIHVNRIVHHGGQAYIADKNLEMYDDYYNHHIGMLIRVTGWSGSEVFFELGGRAMNRDGTQAYVDENGDEKGGYWLIRIDPDTHFASMDVISDEDRNPPRPVLEDGET